MTNWAKREAIGKYMSVSSGTSIVTGSVHSIDKGELRAVIPITAAPFSLAKRAISINDLVRPVWEINTTTSPSLLLIQLMRCIRTSSKQMTGTLKRKNLFCASWATEADAPRPKKEIVLA